MELGVSHRQISSLGLNTSVNYNTISCIAMCQSRCCEYFHTFNLNNKTQNDYEVM